MGTVMAVCIYLGYMDNGYGVLTLNENNKYLLINLKSAYGGKEPGDFFDSLPYGSVCRVSIKEEVNHYSTSAFPESGSGMEQHNYNFIDGGITQDAYAQITIIGEAFSVYNRESGKRIQIRLDTVLGKEVIAGWNQKSKADWIFTEPGNYTQFSDADYDLMYTEWKNTYDTGKKLFVVMTLVSHREEYPNVWAASGGTTVKHYWIIKTMTRK